MPTTPSSWPQSKTSPTAPFFNTTSTLSRNRRKTGAYFFIRTRAASCALVKTKYHKRSTITQPKHSTSPSNRCTLPIHQSSIEVRNVCINKTNILLGTLKRTFKSWNATTFKLLFTTFVRPHLEYAAQVWNPYRVRQVKSIESVQRRATKLVKGIRNMSYEGRLASLGMITLEQRRHRGDLIQTYKCLNGFNKANLFNWQQPAMRAHAMTTRRNEHAMEPQLTRNCTPRETFLTNRVARAWSALSSVRQSTPHHSTSSRQSWTLSSTERFPISTHATLTNKHTTDTYKQTKNISSTCKNNNNNKYPLSYL